MKQAILFWSCDVCEEATSPVATNWREVRKLALARGWTVSAVEDDQGERTHCCPDCGN